MKKQNKKGFTIIELVIVIAVIAILAAVLIPTFTGLINKANRSADEQAVAQMNTAISTTTVLDGKPNGLSDVKKILSDAGYRNDGLKPVSAGYKFYYIPEHNIVALVNDSDGTMVYPDNADAKDYFANNKAKCYDLTTFLPAASVTTLQTEQLNPTVENWISKGNSASITMNTGLTMTADQMTEEQKAEYTCGKWFVDFEITFNKAFSAGFTATEVRDDSSSALTKWSDNSLGFILLGEYGAWDWNAIILTSAEANTPQRVMKDIFAAQWGMTEGEAAQTFEIISCMDHFSCGLKAVYDVADVANGCAEQTMTDEDKELLNGLVVTLELKMYETKEENGKWVETGNSYLIHSYTYDFSSLVK